MPVIDEYRFTLKALQERLSRARKVALEVESSPTQKNKTLLKVLSERLSEHYDQFEEMVQKIVAYNAKNGVEDDLSLDVASYENSYYAVRAVLEATFPSEPRQSAADGSPVSGKHCSGASVQLPKLKLPVFGGNVREWQSFSDLFQATVDANLQLSDAQKHMYLRSSLADEALALVSYLPLTAENYRVCWDTLVKQYDNVHLQTSAHLEALFSLPTTTQHPAHLRRFASQITESVGALTALGHDVESWAVPVLFLCCKRLPGKLREDWERHVIAEPHPSIKRFAWFLQEQARVLEAAHHAPPSPLPAPIKKASKPAVPKSATTLLVSPSLSPTSCALCKKPHLLAQCARFRHTDKDRRLALAKEHRLCLACLLPGHFAAQCSKTTPCRHCSLRHHSLLHFRTGDHRDGQAETPPPASASDRPRDNTSTTLQVSAMSRKSSGSVLLATAEAPVLDSDGHLQTIRVLIDPASQATFVTSHCIKKLGLQPYPARLPILGMGQVPLGVCRTAVRCRFLPISSVELEVDAFVVEHITQAPSEPVPPLSEDRIRGLTLADPHYYRPSAVDMLLGAEWFGQVILDRPIPGPIGTPSLLKSLWGFCIVGRHRKTESMVQCMCVSVAAEPPSMDAIIQRFWEIEEPPKAPVTALEDVRCEELFRTTVFRQVSGRYVVTLPFVDNPPKLGSSRPQALSRFLMLEKRLQRNSIVGALYREFMKDYLAQGHMRVVSKPVPDEEGYYIPHHCIYRQEEDGGVAKFRVVFDSSMATKGGPSLNQILLKGPKLQADIVDLILRFRLWRIVVATDVRQMYRNIAIHESCQNYQRILWRASPEDPISEYCLTTVTYGVASSPFLAIRTLHQLASDEGGAFPAAVNALLSNTYMDDVLASVPSVDDAVRLKIELQALMAKGGFELRKWKSNHPRVLDGLPKEHCAVGADSLSFEENGEPTAKILGLVWTPKSDLFSYSISAAPQAVTKRSIMSDVAKLFDPVGFISPVVFIGKCLIRRLWQLGLDWDDKPPSDVYEQWHRFRQELHRLEDFSLPRWVGLGPHESLELHGFADSSEQGYAGVVYLRVSDKSGAAQVFLLMAKSKVAPLKGHTLPRLELCSIELVTRLLQRALEIFPDEHRPSVTVWNDSTVALHWVKGPPHRWKTFVANRVAACQRRFPPECYRHVPTTMNPADYASRGVYPSELVANTLWREGPSWLCLDNVHWPQLPALAATEKGDAEARGACVVALTVSAEPVSDLFERFSSLTKLNRTIAWMMRFWHNRVLHRIKGENFKAGPLSIRELREATAACCRVVQRTVFARELAALERGNPISKPLRKLCPFVDDHGLLRVGGRLRHSNLWHGQKFPVIIPKRHTFTKLIIRHYHELFLHAGVTNTHAIIARQFWILSARSAISSCISQCVRCFRTNPRSLQPMMGDLPSARVNPGKPFQTTGIDYGGPFFVKMSPGRKTPVVKANVCLFICFSTKAVHLELASDLSTDTFLAALRRFIARRGSVATIHSDCGTNFVGAKGRLEEWQRLTAGAAFNEAASRTMASRGIEWKLNPPASPHFGGLWEAGIKSTKRLLTRVVGEQILTFEELYTVLVQIEATLNSRPLVPLTADPDDIRALTPGHFLLVESTTQLLDGPTPPSEMRPRERWELLRQMVASFWHLWSKDYLNTLQCRHKWHQTTGSLENGMLVVLKDSNQPPLQWKLGRIVQVHPGPDGENRVADVRTAAGIFRRAAVNICPLPLQ